MDNSNSPLKPSNRNPKRKLEREPCANKFRKLDPESGESITPSPPSSSSNSNSDGGNDLWPVADSDSMDAILSDMQLTDNISPDAEAAAVTDDEPATASNAQPPTLIAMVASQQDDDKATTSSTAAAAAAASHSDLEAAKSMLDDDDDDDDLFRGFGTEVMVTKETMDRTMRVDTLGWMRCTVLNACHQSDASLLLLVESQPTATIPTTTKTSTTTIAAAANVRQCRCRLFGAWASSPIVEGDLVTIRGVWNAAESAYFVTMQDGLIIVCPDELISGTTVTGAIFCQRRAVLAERYPAMEGPNRVMFVGTLVHTLFQATIDSVSATDAATATTATTRALVERLAAEMFQSPDMVMSLFEVQMSSADLSAELATFVPRIVAFVERYMLQKKGSRVAVAATPKSWPTPTEKDAFAGTIEQIVDIEENLWVPMMGLKGKVDATVQIHRKRPTGSYESEQVALEVKTGRASFSTEHLGQLNLYQMMMSETGRNAQSGLLLYLRDGTMKEIYTNRNNQRDLILLRNQLAHYAVHNMGKIRSLPTPDTSPDKTHSWPTASDDRPAVTQRMFANRVRSTFGGAPLPEPINHHSGCAACPYRAICTALLERCEPERMREMSATHVLHGIIAQQYLTEEHIDYLVHWSGLIVLEANHCGRDNPISTIWTEAPEMRVDRRVAITDLHVFGRPLRRCDQYGAAISHIFKSTQISIHSWHFTSFTEGDYVRISTRQRCVIAAGRVTDVRNDSIAVDLERDLTRQYPRGRFIIDRSTGSNATNRTNAANLVRLMEDTPKMAHLRTIVIDRRAPTFDAHEATIALHDRLDKNGREMIKTLNDEQREALRRVLCAKDYVLLRGLPGTGKTQTIAILVIVLADMGHRVLVTSHTHSAVDTVLNRVVKVSGRSAGILRLGDHGRISEPMKQFSHQEHTKHCDTPEELRDLYLQYRIVGVTCLGANHPMLANIPFDVCIVDEATQVFQLTALRPLFAARRFVLIGDPDQLAPLVRSNEARLMGADECLFARLDASAASTALASVMLTKQYRMNAAIMAIANAVTYGNKLTCGTQRVADACLQLGLPTGTPIKFGSIWVKATLDPDLRRSCVLLDTGNVYKGSECISEKYTLLRRRRQGVEFPASAAVRTAKMKRTKRRLYENFAEASVILHLIRALLKHDVPAKDIGIMAPYTTQVEILRQIIPDKTIEVNTIDQFQGRDKSVMFLTCTKCDNPAFLSKPAQRSTASATEEPADILSDMRRMTVAVTRAKHKFIVVGDVSSLQCYKPFVRLFRAIGQLNRFILRNGEMGFDWEQTLSEIMRLTY